MTRLVNFQFHCKIGDTLENMLRDLIVVGLADDSICRWLLSKRKLTYANACDIVLAMEVAKMLVTLKPVQQLQYTTYHRKKSTRWNNPLCFEDWNWNKNHVFGATINIFPNPVTSKKWCVIFATKPVIFHQPVWLGKTDWRTHNIQRREAVGEAAEWESSSLHSLFNLQGNGKTNSLMVLVGINGCNIEIEIDTGAAVSLISHAAFENLWWEADKSKLWPMSQKLATYTGENITQGGRCQVSVDYDGQQYCLPLVVLPGVGPMLQGRNKLQLVQLS